MTEAKAGFAWSVRIAGALVDQYEPIIRENYEVIDIMDAVDNEAGPASVGTSMTASTSQNFGKIKVEATAWCTLPCPVDGVKETAKLVREIVKSDVQDAFREAHDAFMSLHEEYGFSLEDS